MGKLTKGGINHAKLTNHLSSPFVLCFKYKLENGYSFEDLRQNDLKPLQSFLDHVADMTFQDVEKTYKRQSDRNDVYQGEQVIHLGIAKGFRIHGVLEEGRFVVLRLDPRHEFHKS